MNVLKKQLTNLCIILLVSVFMASCQKKSGKETRSDNNPDDIELAKIVRKGNIFYDSAAFQTGAPHVPPYAANGIIGGCFDHMGFQSRPNTGTPEGRTVLGYIDSYYQHESSRQIQLPLAYIQAEFADGSTILNMMQADDYRQELDLFTGVLTTEYNLFGKTKIQAYAHQTIPNLFIMKINRKPDSPEKELVVSIHCETSKAQNRDFNWKAEPIEVKFSENDKSVDIQSTTNLSTTNWTIQSNNNITVEENKVKIHLKNEENLIKILVNRDDCPGTDVLDKSYTELLADHTKEWEKLWNESWIDFPAGRAQKIWMRSKYYAICNFPSIPEKPMIPTGLNTNIWGFTYPQDVYYVMENLLPAGHFERYEKSLQYWLDILPEVKKYSKRIMGVEAGFYPWTPPYTQWDEYEKHDVVGHNSYEMHNPAYVAAMVWHYYEKTADIEALRKYFPVLEEVWRFYESILYENEQGRYYVFHPLGTGQDEAHDGQASKNLLCASYSAEYALKKYLKAIELIAEYDKYLAEKAKKILEAGLDREANMKENGMLASFIGDDRPANRQKHPVQLNTITFLPMGENVTPGSPAEVAYEHRHSLTTEALKPVTHGWTYGAFLLASSRMRSPEGFKTDINAVQYYAGADPRWIQFYEYTFWERWHLKLAYYFPTQGLYQQAYTNAIVQDWRGYADIFACLLPEWKKEKIAFKGLRVTGGAKVSGQWDNGSFSVTLSPGSKKEVEVRISQNIKGITATGQKEGPESFNGNEIVRFTFDGDKEIVLEKM